MSKPVKLPSDSEDDYRTGCRNVSHCQQQQSYSGIRSPGSPRTIILNLLMYFLYNIINIFLYHIINIFMMKNLTDFRKTVVTGVDARLLEQRKK